ncbi:MAG: stage III sporulation protein D [Clostridia bacterium]|jgi:putative DeoR family transcriptional regulator (stage III sporulation protein D)|uniref:sporulation transcriptional regulator SpoIIID n=1 Tax=Pumilibacter muris TaxID=2941510 RepID=UPI0020422F80|nr:sporulation transcriptional regulator SpoIIID [Pumilibacter muris]MCI8596294.1 stage III sporulation protein D [Clostridia bacterium]
MKTYIVSRARTLAEHIAATGDTVRGAGEKFGVSKSTVHKDVTERLRDIDAQLYMRVKEILELNLNERHLRGGNATKEKYRREREE